MTTNVFYFYNGFEAPKKVNIDEITIVHNYLGGVTSDFIEVYNDWKDDSDDALNEQIGFYGVYRNPTVDTFRELNVYKYGLEENEYLDEWI